VTKCSYSVQAGADPNTEDEAGARPIDAAASTRERAVVELLLPVTKPAPSGDWTASWLLEHAERAAQVPEHSHCGCGHSHGPGHEHAHAPDTDEVAPTASARPGCCCRRDRAGMPASREAAVGHAGRGARSRGAGRGRGRGGEAARR
jgi:hypothetical protein